MKGRWGAATLDPYVLGPYVLGAGVLGAYVGVPYLLFQVLNVGLLREGRRTKRELALTFDDGPDPASTPAVLDALNAAGAQATFFVVADRAERHPHLIRRMLSEGHTVEAHAALHRHAWLRSPWGAFLDPIRAARRVAAVSGRPVTLHRPPHGAYTLTTWLGQRAAGVRGAHWSTEGQDWRRDRTPTAVRERLETLAVPGAVIVLHDAGPGARTTVTMLPELLENLAARGYRFRTLADLDGLEPLGWAGLRRRAFTALDALVDRAGGARWAAGRHDRMLRFARVGFPLAGVRLPTGEAVRRGSPCTEFHANNALMVDLGLRRTIAAAREDFRWLAAQLLKEESESGAGAAPMAGAAPTEWVFCISALPSVLAALGFTNVPLTGSSRHRLRGWANVLRRAYGNAPNAPAPVLSILSRAEFLRLYGPR